MRTGSTWRASPSSSRTGRAASRALPEALKIAVCCTPLVTRRSGNLRRPRLTLIRQQYRVARLSSAAGDDTYSSARLKGTGMSSRRPWATGASSHSKLRSPRWRKPPPEPPREGRLVQHEDAALLRVGAQTHRVPGQQRAQIEDFDLPSSAASRSAASSAQDRRHRRSRSWRPGLAREVRPERHQ